MKKAILIDVFSPDVEDLPSFKPDDPENFCILLQLSVGFSENDLQNPSGETFDLEVYTPKWLLSKYKKDAIFFPRHTLLVFSFNYREIYKKIKRAIEYCTGETWEEIAKKINTFAAWEFEEYQEID